MAELMIAKIKDKSRPSIHERLADGVPAISEDAINDGARVKHTEASCRRRFDALVLSHRDGAHCREQRRPQDPFLCRTRGNRKIFRESVPDASRSTRSQKALVVRVQSDEAGVNDTPVSARQNGSLDYDRST
jgi:hypothetical protein